MSSKILTVFVLTVLVCFMFLEQSCESDSLPEPAPPTFCDTTEATYLTTVKPIIDQSCAISGCHLPGTSAPGNFTFYVGLEGYFDGDQLEQRIFLETDPLLRMPPINSPPEAMLSQEQMDILECWIDAGYPEE